MVKVRISDSFCTWEYKFSPQIEKFSIREIAKMIEQGTGASILSHQLVDPMPVVEPCPLCGHTPAYTDNEARCSNRECMLYDKTFTRAKWSMR